MSAFLRSKCHNGTSLTMHLVSPNPFTAFQEGLVAPSQHWFILSKCFFHGPTFLGKCFLKEHFSHALTAMWSTLKSGYFKNTLFSMLIERAGMQHLRNYWLWDIIHESSSTLWVAFVSQPSQEWPPLFTSRRVMLSEVSLVILVIQVN